ncbi:DMT family transporter [Ilumatobacter nonamiensis]|uniref:DMT family transporter n=1 Tax=Ilumatobacter nonamiensis TaxID=467093 RepID=UPI00058B590A|nr:DMT family transporter [Ilumatobacter nonamiensis]
MSRIGVVRCLLAAVLFGASAPLASELAGSLPTFTLAGLLYVGAAFAAAPVTIRRPPSTRALRAEWRPAAAAVVIGGAVGPVLLVAGLARTDPATSSILLNAELAATVVLAAVVFREHLGSRMWVAAGLITVAGGMLTWQPGASLDVGALLVIAACAAWGFDNGLTASIGQLAPEHVVMLKGVIAGGANLAIGLLLSGWGSATTLLDVLAALAIGAAGYGLSITLWVKGARDLGAARGQVIFATAPFIGAVIAWTLLGDDATGVQIVAALIAGVGVAISLRSAHEHSHRHAEIVHEHEHIHADEHHDHNHGDGVAGRHSHVHEHRPLVHAHPHVPDLHHRHDH